MMTSADTSIRDRISIVLGIEDLRKPIVSSNRGDTLIGEKFSPLSLLKERIFWIRSLCRCAAKRVCLSSSWWLVSGSVSSRSISVLMMTG